MAEIACTVEGNVARVLNEVRRRGFTSYKIIGRGHDPSTVIVPSDEISRVMDWYYDTGRFDPEAGIPEGTLLDFYSYNGDQERDE